MSHLCDRARPACTGWTPTARHDRRRRASPRPNATVMAATGQSGQVQSGRGRPGTGEAKVVAVGSVDPGGHRFWRERHVREGHLAAAVRALAAGDEPASRVGVVESGDGDRAAQQRRGGGKQFPHLQRGGRSWAAGHRADVPPQVDVPTRDQRRRMHGRSQTRRLRPSKGRPLQGRYQHVVVDEAQHLNRGGAESLAGTGRCCAATRRPSAASPLGRTSATMSRAQLREHELGRPDRRPEHHRGGPACNRR
jgi:hypothetical protein